MGYCTYFEDVSDPPMTSDEFDALDEIAGFNITFDESMKWYDYKVHMAKLSLKFPDRLFRLTGDGEDSDDFWKGYWLNGKAFVTKAIITYESFSEDEMDVIVEPEPPPPELIPVSMNATPTVLNWDF